MWRKASVLAGEPIKMTRSIPCTSRPRPLPGDVTSSCPEFCWTSGAAREAPASADLSIIASAIDTALMPEFLSSSISFMILRPSGIKNSGALASSCAKTSCTAVSKSSWCVVTTDTDTLAGSATLRSVTHSSSLKMFPLLFPRMTSKFLWSIPILVSCPKRLLIKRRTGRPNVADTANTWTSPPLTALMWPHSSSASGRCRSRSLLSLRHACLLFAFKRRSASSITTDLTDWSFSTDNGALSPLIHSSSIRGGPISTGVSGGSSMSIVMASAVSGRSRLKTCATCEASSRVGVITMDCNPVSCHECFASMGST
mmetsp:Transcript_72535/g.125878  ORF Transcript_72535/g.125878 Transcript_72535/m.125878 type:complete len:313 (-) Transcript_72535:720-1658(-)